MIEGNGSESDLGILIWKMWFFMQVVFYSGVCHSAVIRLFEVAQQLFLRSFGRADAKERAIAERRPRRLPGRCPVSPGRRWGCGRALGRVRHGTVRLYGAVEYGSGWRRGRAWAWGTERGASGHRGIATGTGLGMVIHLHPFRSAEAPFLRTPPSFPSAGPQQARAMLGRESWQTRPYRKTRRTCYFACHYHCDGVYCIRVRNCNCM